MFFVFCTVCFDPRHPILKFSRYLAGKFTFLQHIGRQDTHCSFKTIFALSGACLGVGDVMGNTLLVWVWQKKVGPWMQLLHFGFGFGAVLVGSLFGILQTYFGEEVIFHLNNRV